MSVHGLHADGADEAWMDVTVRSDVTKITKPVLDSPRRDLTLCGPQLEVTKVLLFLLSVD